MSPYEILKAINDKYYNHLDLLKDFDFSNYCPDNVYNAQIVITFKNNTNMYIYINKDVLSVYYRCYKETQTLTGSKLIAAQDIFEQLIKEMTSAVKQNLVDIITQL